MLQYVVHAHKYNCSEKGSYISVVYLKYELKISSKISNEYCQLGEALTAMPVRNGTLTK